MTKEGFDTGSKGDRESLDKLREARKKEQRYEKVSPVRAEMI